MTLLVALLAAIAAAVVLGRSRYVLSNRIRTSLASLTPRSTSCGTRRTSLSILAVTVIATVTVIVTVTDTDAIADANADANTVDANADANANVDCLGRVSDYE